MLWGTDIDLSGLLAALRAGAWEIERGYGLGLATLVLLALAGFALRRGPLTAAVPDVPRTAKARLDPSWKLSILLRLAALFAIALALARPVGLLPENPAGGSGIDLVIALDASVSMQALDANIDGRRVTRLELAKRVVSDFVRQRQGDRLGLVVFGEHAFTQCPLTVDHRLVLSGLERIESGIAGDSTALGEAIGLGVRRLRVAGAPDGARRILLLLTDGRHNAGKLAPTTAAQIARMEQVHIYTIGIGTTGSVPFAQDHPGEPLRFEEVELDHETLQRVALLSDGEFFHAEHPDDLREIIQTIDQLEIAPSPSETRQRRASLAPFSLMIALLLLTLEALTCHGILRRLP